MLYEFEVTAVSSNFERQPYLVYDCMTLSQRDLEGELMMLMLDISWRQVCGPLLMPQLIVLKVTGGYSMLPIQTTVHRCAQ